MLLAFKERRPWAAAIITILFGPFVACLYMGRGRLALLYLVAFEVVFYASVASLFIAGEPQPRLDLYFDIFLWSAKFLASVHVYWVARSINPEDRLAWFSRWYWLVAFSIIIPFALALTIRTFLFEAFSISSHSMAPALQKNDQLLSTKFAYGYSKHTFGLASIANTERLFGSIPEHGDIVTFKLPSNPSFTFVKRVIGLPGDTVQVRNGQLFLNDAPTIIEQVETTTGVPKIGSGTDSWPTFKETLPNGISYLIIGQRFEWQGDNTEEYLVPDGHVFVLGDNRDNSNDSRFDKVGFIPIENLTGRVDWLYWIARESRLNY